MSTAADAAGPVGFSVPSTKPSRSRSSKYLKPCTSSTTAACSPSRPRQLARPARSTGPSAGPGCGRADRRASRRTGAARRRTREAGAAPRAGGRRRAGPRTPSRCRRRTQLAVRDAEADRPAQPGDVGKQIAGHLLARRIHRDDKENRRLGQRREDRLRLRREPAGGVGVTIRTVSLPGRCSGSCSCCQNPALDDNRPSAAIPVRGLTCPAGAAASRAPRRARERPGARSSRSEVTTRSAPARPAGRSRHRRSAGA